MTTSEQAAANFMQTRDFCIICRVAAETNPAPQGWSKWASANTVDNFYMFSTCPACSESIRKRHDITSRAVSEAVERIVEALKNRRDKTPKDLQSYAMNTAIAILCSRDWSKGDTHE